MNISYGSPGLFRKAALLRYASASGLLAEVLAFIVEDLDMAFASGVTVAFIGGPAWGLHMGLHGMLSAMFAGKRSVRVAGTGVRFFQYGEWNCDVAGERHARILWVLDGSSGQHSLGGALALNHTCRRYLYKDVHVRIMVVETNKKSVRIEGGASRGRAYAIDLESTGKRFYQVNYRKVRTSFYRLDAARRDGIQVSHTIRSAVENSVLAGFL